MDQQKTFFRKFWWMITVIIVLIVGFGLWLFSQTGRNNNGQDIVLVNIQNQGAKPADEKKTTNFPSLEAKYITAVPLDLTQIERISKYRSCAGHDRSGYSFEKVLETDRSMKHYFFPVAEFQGTLDKVKMFAPFDGEVTSLAMDEGKTGKRVHTGNGITFSTSLDTDVAFQFGHIYFVEDFKVGDTVKAGQLIGYAALGDPGFDFDIDLMGAHKFFENKTETEILGSIFNHMTDTVLAEFAKYGITPERMSFAKEYRDQHPCYYNEPQKIDPVHQGRENEDWMALTH